MSRKAALLSILLCLCFVTQSTEFARADELESPAVIEPAAPSVETETVASAPAPQEAVEEVVAVEPEDSVAAEQVAGVDASEATESDGVAEPAEGSLAGAEEPAVTSDDEATTASTTETAVEVTADATSSTPLSTAVPATTTAAVSTTTAATSSVTTETQIPPVVSATATTTETPSESPTGGSSGGGSSDVSDSEVESNPAEAVDAPPSTDVSSTSSAPAEVLDEEEAFVGEPPTTTNDDLVFTVESDTHFSFNKNECTRIEDGTFYCQKHDTALVLEDSLIAAPDSDGDLEIYLVRDGERYQITQNQVDDASPYYDELSKSIVWHRLLNDRYQIIAYDIESGEERQITNTSVNNMEPSRHGKHIVWQRWVENNWEVILYDGNTEEQISHSARHDIAPHIRGPLVIWNSQSNDGSQELKTYDIPSRTQTTIADSEGVSVSNPRMVVMYETLYENGDIVTKGFDLVSGKVVPLQALPKQLPAELPDAEPTKEVRALIQSKPEPKETSVAEVAPTSGGSGTSTASSTDSEYTAATTSEETLDLRSLSTPELVHYLTDQADATTTIPDLVITPDESSLEPSDAEVSESVIPDLVIEPINTSESSATSTQITQE